MSANKSASEKPKQAETGRDVGSRIPQPWDCWVSTPVGNSVLRACSDFSA